MRKLVAVAVALVAVLALAVAASGQSESTPGSVLDAALDELQAMVAVHHDELADHEQRIAALEDETPPPPPPPAAACDNDLDDDGDSLVDLEDPGCESATDDDETDPPPPPPPLAACENGVDDDGDGLVDFPADPGCSSSTDNAELDDIPPPPPPGEVVCLVSNRDTWELAGRNCSYGTLIEFTNEQFRCNGPLASYGELPLKLVWTFTGNPNFGDQGHLMFGSGCHGDNNEDTVDVIVASNADGRTVGACGGAGKFQQSPGPHDIQITGNFDSGPLCGTAHQDVWQFHPANPEARLDIINGISGDYDAGLATTIGAGGAIFFSANYDVDVYGGEYVTCNHGYDAHNSNVVGLVIDAKFRTGRTDGTDPRCNGIFASNPCIGPANFQNVTCERWVGGAWVPRPPG